MQIWALTDELIVSYSQVASRSSDRMNDFMTVVIFSALWIFVMIKASVALETQ